MPYLLQCSAIARQLSSSALDGGSVFIFLLLWSSFLTSRNAAHPVGTDFGLVALLSLSVVAATCAVRASNLADVRVQSSRGLRPALIQGMQAAAAGALVAIPLSYAYGVVTRGSADATPNLAQISIALVPIPIFLSRFMQCFMPPSGRPRRRIAIIGDRNVESRIASQRDITRKFQIAGSFELEAVDRLGKGNPLAEAERASRLQQFLQEANPDEVVIACCEGKAGADAGAGLPVWDLLRAKANGLRVIDFPEFWERETGRIDLQSLRPDWLLFGPGLCGSSRFLFCKRAIDILVASTLLALTAWMFVMVFLAVKTTSRGPAIYRQERVGLNGRTFTLLKFRSMYVDAEHASGPMWARSNDPRVTAVGSFLRRTRLDELPQLWNILRGDMSLVGPRPERVHFVQILSRSLPCYGLRHAMKPGLTGWAQVSHGYAASVAESADKLSYDLFYIRHSSVVFDLFILVTTLGVVMKRAGQ